MAMKAEAPIVPVAVQGGRDAMRRGSKVIQPVTVSIRVGEPIETVGLQPADRDALIAKVRASIEALLAQGPVDGPGVHLQGPYPASSWEEPGHEDGRIPHQGPNLQDALGPVLPHQVLQYLALDRADNGEKALPGALLYLPQHNFGGLQGGQRVWCPA